MTTGYSVDSRLIEIIAQCLRRRTCPPASRVSTTRLARATAMIHVRVSFRTFVPQRRTWREYRILTPVSTFRKTDRIRRGRIFSIRCATPPLQLFISARPGARNAFNFFISRETQCFHGVFPSRETRLAFEPSERDSRTTAGCGKTRVETNEDLTLDSNGRGRPV